MSSYSLRNFATKLGKYLRYIGFATFSLENEKVHVSVHDFVCLSFNLSLGFLVFYLSLNYGIERLAKYSILLSLGVLITMMCGSLVSILSMIIVFQQRESIWEVVRILDQTIDKFRKIHVYPDFKRYIVIFICLAVVAACCIVFGIFAMGFWFGYSQKLGVLLIYGYLSTSFSASMGWSTMFHLSVYLRIKMINSTIR